MPITLAGGLWPVAVFGRLFRPVGPFLADKAKQIFLLIRPVVEIIFQHEDLLFSEGFSFAQMDDFAALADNPHDISSEMPLSLQ